MPKPAMRAGGRRKGRVKTFQHQGPPPNREHHQRQRRHACHQQQRRIIHTKHAAKQDMLQIPGTTADRNQRNAKPKRQ